MKLMRKILREKFKIVKKQDESKLVEKDQISEEKKSKPVSAFRSKNKSLMPAIILNPSSEKKKQAIYEKRILNKD